MTKNDASAGDFSGLNLLRLVERVEGAEPGDFIAYDESKCNGCGACALVCSVRLWTVKDKAKLSPNYGSLCLECAACYAVCEPDAIGFRYPEGGAGIVIRHG